MKIADHFHALRIFFAIPVGPGKTVERFVYVYFIMGREVCLVDSGVKDSEKLIFCYLESIGRTPREISQLILTHAHPDHIGSAHAVRAASGCSVAAHPEARAWIEDVELQFSERPVPGFHALVSVSTPVDRLLQDGDIIDLGPVSLEVMLTPGHASGSISLYCKDEGVLISGDAIPRAGDLPIYDDVVTTVASIRRLKAIQSIKHLLASWMDPLAGSAVYEMMDDGLAYLQRIHEEIRYIAGSGKVVDPMKLCARMVKVMGLPEIAVNPLIAKSFASHLKIIGQEKLF